MQFRTVVARVRPYGTSLALVASLGLVVVQARQLREFKRPPEPKLAVGTVVPPLDVKSLDGRGTVVRYDQPRIPTILYYFSSSCGWCERNWANVVALEKATRDRYRLVAIAVESDLRRTVAEHGLEFAVFGGLTPQQRRQVGLTGTPHTLVVAPDGSLLADWVGAFSNRNRRAIEAYFGVRLPGVTRAAPAARVP